MEFSDVVRRRRMVRNYDPHRGVDRDTIITLLDLATRAPSAGFSQGWHFLVLEDPADRERFWSASTQVSDQVPTGDVAPVGNRWLSDMRSAPVLILALSDKQAYLDRYAEADKAWTDLDEGRWPVPYWDVDTGMASLILLLAAVDRGLSACFFGVPAVAHARLRAAFGIDEQLRFLGVVSLGHGVTDRRSPSLKRGRRPLAEVISFGRMS